MARSSKGSDGDDDLDSRVRYAIYQHFVGTARGPSAERLSDLLRVTISDLERSLNRLHNGHAIVLRTGSTDVLMAHPFSSVPTGYETHVGDMVYWPNCGWDSMGIAAALGRSAEVKFRCPDCDESIEFAIVDGKLDDNSLRVHFAVPARHWWDDIEFT